jgi:hypothetical protein
MFVVRTCIFQTRHSMRNPVVYDELKPFHPDMQQQCCIMDIHRHALLLYSWEKQTRARYLVQPLWGWTMFPATCIWSNWSAGYSCYRSWSLHNRSTVTKVVWQVLSLRDRQWLFDWGIVTGTYLSRFSLDHLHSLCTVTSSVICNRWQIWQVKSNLTRLLI